MMRQLEGQHRSRKMKMSDRKKQELMEQCQLSSLYHEHRECFLNTCHRVVLFVIIMSSALLASGLLRDYTLIERILTISPVFLAASDLVFNFSTASQTHKFLRHRFSYLEAQLNSNKISKETLCEVSKDITRLTAEEPPAYRVLLHHCTNLIDLRKNTEPTLKINFFFMMFRNIFRFGGSQPIRIRSK